MIAGIFLLGKKGNKNELNFPKTALYSFLYLLYNFKEEKEELNAEAKKRTKRKGERDGGRREDDDRTIFFPIVIGCVKCACDKRGI